MKPPLPRARIRAHPGFLHDLRRVLAPAGYARVASRLESGDLTWVEFQGLMQRLLPGGVEFVEVGEARRRGRRERPRGGRA